MNDTSLTVAPAAGRVRLDADVLKARRHQLGLSQEAFALACFERQLCVSIASVKRAETGKSLLLRTARHLAEFHGLALQALLLSDQDGCDEDGLLAPVPEANATEEIQMDGRLVQLLCVWPVSDRERAGVETSMREDGAAVLPAPFADTVLAVFGLPKAQRGDLARCLVAASRWRDRHVLIAGGRWQAAMLEWPHDCMQTWVRRQVPAIYVHRSMFGQVRTSHQVDAVSHVDLGKLGAAHRQVRRQFALAGRQHEMRLHGSLLNSVLADQQSQVMLVQGMAGMGKSRLLAEMVDFAQQHFLCAVQVEIQDFGGDRHRAVCAALLKSLLDLHEVTPFWDQLVNQRVGHFGLQADQMLVCRELLAMSLGAEERLVLQAMGHAARAQLLVQLLATIVARMALQRPMLIVVEDAHWASASTIETLARVMTASHEAQVLWVLSGRVEEPQRLADLQRMIPDVAVTSLSLAPLRPHEVKDLLHQFDHVDEAWRHQCIQRAQGHPLFLTQLLMADRHECLPDNFQHLLQVRLDEVSPQDRHALRLAAVLGQSFSTADIHALMPVPGYQLDALVQHCFLRHLDGDRFDFLHALIRQGIYEALPVRQREAMHVQMAQHFEACDTALAAQHLHKARQARAPAALLSAAQARHEDFDHEAALSLLLMYGGIDYAPRDEQAYAMLLGDVHAKMGSMPQARKAYELAVVKAEDEVTRLMAKVALAGVLNVLEDLAAEEALIDEALPQAEAVGALAQQAALHYLKGNLYFPRGDVVRSRAHHGRAMEVARLAGAARLQAQALSGLGDSFYAEGLMQTANEHFVRCLRLCDEHSLKDIEASNRFMLATTQIYLCQAPQALTEALASALLARRVGNRRAELVSRLTASWVELGYGRPQEALVHINEGLMICRSMGAMRFEPFLQEAQARALYASGDEVLALRVIQMALDGVERLKLQAFIGPWVMGTWALLHSQDDRAMGMIERGQAQIERGCVAHNAYRFHASAMEVCTLNGWHDMARRLGESWLQVTGREPTPWVRLLHDFMTRCQDLQSLPHPDDPCWMALREQQMLHVLLKLPRALLR